MQLPGLRRQLGLVAFLLVCSAPTAGLAASATVQSGSKTVVVEAVDETPTRTGVRVRKGDRLLVTATGTWCLGGQPPTAECGGPAGIRLANPVELPLILNRAKIGKLVGRIGNGPWFAVGKRARITAKRGGQLQLLFNDRPCCFGDNSGSVTARIRKLKD
jgi:hypothetical protein